jgi:tRNA(fMet)-specific endonuclease VapC
MIRPLVLLTLGLGAASPALAQSAALGSPLGSPGHGPTMLIHGNYCGPGNNAPRPPIDALDAACARHDACTPDGALPSRACNLRLQRDADLISRDPRQPEDLRALAGLVAAGAAIMPADPDLARRGLAAAPVVAPAAEPHATTGSLGRTVEVPSAALDPDEDEAE